MGVTAVLSQVLIIFLLIIVGLVAAKLGYITRDVRRGLIEILVNLAIPSLVIISFDTDMPASALADAGIVLVFSLVSSTAAALLARFLYRRYAPGSRAVMSFVTVFTNCAFMGFPVMESIFGSQGVFFASIYTLTFNLFLWTYGQMLFTGSGDRKVLVKALLNTGTISVLIGIFLLLTPLSIPTLGQRVLSLVGGLTTPLAMMVIGSMLAEVRLKELFHGRGIFTATVLRLLVLPALTFFILQGLGVSREITAICTVLLGLPAASNAVIFAEKFNGDSMLATRIVVITTALSIVTIPAMTVLIR